MSREIPPHLEREGRLLRGLREQPRRKRPTSVEVYCRCPKNHLLISVHPITGSPGEVAVWVHGNDREPIGSLGDVGDPLAVMQTLAASGRLAEVLRSMAAHGGELTDELARTRVRAADHLLVRPLARLAAGETYLGSPGAACVRRSSSKAMRRAALTPQTAGPLIAEEHEAWLAGGMGKPSQLFAD